MDSSSTDDLEGFQDAISMVMWGYWPHSRNNQAVSLWDKCMRDAREGNYQKFSIRKSVCTKCEVPSIGHWRVEAPEHSWDSPTKNISNWDYPAKYLVWMYHPPK